MTDYQRFNRITAEQEAQHPVFVFGTLRPGNGNTRTYEGVAWAEYDGEATLADHRLVSNGAFPYCLPSPGSVTIGALIVTFPDYWAEAMRRMDALEGVPVHYDRVKCTVGTPDGDMESWYYVPTDWKQYERLSPVPGNDWAQHVRAPRPNFHDAAWWN